MELSSITHLLVWGDLERFHSNVAFLLILPKEGIAGERVYGLVMVWVHPYQVRVSTVEDVAKKLILLASTRPNWPYSFMQFNGDAHHVPLPKEGHLSPPSCKWTSCNSQWMNMSPRPCVLAVVQPLLPPHALLWSLPPR